MRVIAWSILATITIVTSIILVYSPISQSFSNLTIEIVGAMLGVLAAIEISELIKEIDYTIGAKKVKTELLRFLQNILTNQIPGEMASLDLEVWDTIRTSQRFSYLPDNDRSAFFAAFGSVKIYNERCDDYLNTIRRPNVTQTLLQSLENFATVAQNFMISMIRDVLQNH